MEHFDLSPLEEKMDDEITIDLKKYVATLFRQWQLIIGITVIALIGVGIYTLATTPAEYESSVIIATTKTLASVDFGSVIKIFTPEQAAITNLGLANLLYDRKARQQSYVEMVKDPAIAQIVLEGLGNRLPEKDRNLSEYRLYSHHCQIQ
jgi:capsular polysaccharide biosynthesis protein